MIVQLLCAIAVVAFNDCEVNTVPLQGIIDRCDYGPAYWCKNMSTAMECYSVKFCFGTDRPDVSSEADQIPSGLAQLEPKQLEMCALCEFVLHNLQHMMAGNTSVVMIQRAIERVCRVMPETLSDLCHDFVVGYSKPLLILLAEAVNPRHVCPILRICPSKYESVAGALEATLSVAYAGYSDESDIRSTDVSSRSPKRKTRCSICKAVFKRALKTLGNTRVKSVVQATFHAMCDRLPHFHDLCKMQVDMIIDVLNDPAQRRHIYRAFCTSLGLCRASFENYLSDREGAELTAEEETGRESILVYSTAENLRDDPKEEDDNDELNYVDESSELEMPTLGGGQISRSCVLCEFVMTQLNLSLGNDTKNHQSIKTAVTTVCLRMPRTVYDSCRLFMRHFQGRIVSLLPHLGIARMCNALFVCPSGATESLPDAGAECDLCQETVNSLENSFGQRQDYGELDSRAMEAALCAALPGKYYESCSQIVGIYVQRLATLMGNHLDICTEIGKCLGVKPAGRVD